MNRSLPSLPARLLVVEDDHVQLRAWQVIADRFGSKVTTASRTTEVLRLAMVERPDAIVLDLELEDGDSLPLLGCLRTSPETCDIPLLMVSGCLSPEAEEACRSHEVQVVRKPWLLDELLELLEQLDRPAPAA